MLEPSEHVHDLLNRIAKKAKWMNCRLVLSHRPQFFRERRVFSSQAMLRSTTHRLGITALGVHQVLPVEMSDQLRFLQHSAVAGARPLLVCRYLSFTFS